MKSQTFFYNLKIFLYNLAAVILILTYIFLIAWTYCYALFVMYLLLISFVASIVLYSINRSKRQAVKFLILGMLLFVVLSPFNLRQYNQHATALQERINKRGGELTTREKLGVYGCLIMMTVFDAIPFPEVSKENFYLFFPTEGNVRTFNSNSFLKSPSIKRTINTKNQGLVAWNKWNYIFNEDFRYSVAFDPCTIETVNMDGNKKVVLTTYFHYRKNYTTVHATNFLGGMLSFRIDEGLFWYLQEKKWLHPYKAIWIANL